MITHFRHRHLRRFQEQNDRSELPQAHVARIKRVLDQLDDAEGPEDMNRPGLRLHRLRGDLDGFWSMRVSGNLRIIFRFESRDAVDVDPIDDRQQER